MTPTQSSAGCHWCAWVVAMPDLVALFWGKCYWEGGWGVFYTFWCKKICHIGAITISNRRWKNNPGCTEGNWTIGYVCILCTHTHIALTHCPRKKEVSCQKLNARGGVFVNNAQGCMWLCHIGMGYRDHMKHDDQYNLGLCHVGQWQLCNIYMGSYILICCVREPSKPNS